MADFAPWLHGLTSDEADLKALRDYATSKGAAWPYWSNTRADYEQVIDTDTADDATKKAHRAALAAYYKLWQHEQTSSGGKGATYFLAGLNLGKIALIAFGVALGLFLYFFLKGQGFLSSLAQIDQARGLITFFFVLVTTGVIVLVALGIFWVESADDAQKRFQSAKDLLTIVIGVLGTIMGFYFGSATGGPANFTLSNVAVAPLSVQAEKEATLTGQITGGTKPYTYSVLFTDPTGKMPDKQLADMGVTDKKSQDGTIDQKIKAPAVEKNSLVVFVLSAHDAKNVSMRTTGALFLTPKPPPK